MSLINIDIAQIVRDKNLIQLSDQFYDGTGQLIHSHYNRFSKHKSFSPCVTMSELQDVLREKYRVDVLITMSEFSRKYGYNIYSIENGRTVRVGHVMSKNEDYNLVLSEALLEGLNYITI